MTPNIRAELNNELEKLKQKHRKLMHGRVVPPPKAQRVQREIIEKENEIKRLDIEAAKRLSVQKLPIEEILEIIAIPLLADVMNNLVAGVDGALRKAGLQKSVFSMHVSRIRRAALEMMDTLDKAEESLPRLLDDDETLVDAIHKKLMSFVKQRLNIKKGTKTQSINAL